MSVEIDGTLGITTPALDSEGNLEYSGTLTGGTGVVNIGSGQVYKDASGNIGVNTTNPEEALHINKGSNSAIRLGSVGVNFAYRLRANVTEAVNGGFLIENAETGADLYSVKSGAGGEHVFSIEGDTKVVIDSSGDLLVGTTDDSTTSTNDGLICSGGIPGVIYSRRTSGSFRTHISFRNGGSAVGSIASTTSATSYLTSSDYRLKEDTQPVVKPINRLMQLKPINFAWKVDGSRTDGFLAHEAQAVVPEAVTGQKDAVDAEGKPEYQGIDQSKLVPLLTAAIQEQQTLIQALTARIEALEQA